jgi:hypothetical protein
MPSTGKKVRVVVEMPTTRFNKLLSCDVEVFGQDRKPVQIDH